MTACFLAGIFLLQFKLASDTS